MAVKPCLSTLTYLSFSFFNKGASIVPSLLVFPLTKAIYVLTILCFFNSYLFLTKEF